MSRAMRSTRSVRSKRGVEMTLHSEDMVQSSETAATGSGGGNAATGSGGGNAFGLLLALTQ